MNIDKLTGIEKIFVNKENMMELDASDILQNSYDFVLDSITGKYLMGSFDATIKEVCFCSGDTKYYSFELEDGNKIITLNLYHDFLHCYNIIKIDLSLESVWISYSDVAIHRLIESGQDFDFAEVVCSDKVQSFNSNIVTNEIFNMKTVTRIPHLRELRISLHKSMTSYALYEFPKVTVCNVRNFTFTFELCLGEEYLLECIDFVSRMTTLGFLGMEFVVYSLDDVSNLLHCESNLHNLVSVAEGKGASVYASLMTDTLYTTWDANVIDILVERIKDMYKGD